MTSDMTFASLKGLFLQPCLYTWFDLTVDDKVRTVGEKMEKENK